MLKKVVGYDPRVVTNVRQKLSLVIAGLRINLFFGIVVMEMSRDIYGAEARVANAAQKNTGVAEFAR